MDVEILSVELNKGIVYFYCNDISDENLRRLERMRDDATEEEVVFSFDTHDPKALKILRAWLLNQKITQGSTTWGEALQSVVGTVTVLPKKFREWKR